MSSNPMPPDSSPGDDAQLSPGSRQNWIVTLAILALVAAMAGLIALFHSGRVDFTAPKLTCESNLPAWTSQAQFMLGVNIDEAHLQSLRWGGRKISAASGSISLAWVLKEGRNDRRLTALDRFGNETSLDFTIGLDSEAPELQLILPDSMSPSSAETGHSPLSEDPESNAERSKGAILKISGDLKLRVIAKDQT